MSKPNFRNAEKQAYELLRKTFLEENICNIELPIVVSDVIREQDLSIYRFRNKEESLNKISGAYEREKKKIYVDENDVIERQRFTLAHELGHHILHKNVKTEYLPRQESYWGEEKPDIEKEADFFAACFLMPKELVIKVFKEKTKKINELAILFGVSPQAMRYRLSFLGLKASS